MEQYNVTGMSCAACSARVEKAVTAVEGGTSCSVSLLTNSMGVEGTASAEAIAIMALFAFVIVHLLIISFCNINQLLLYHKCIKNANKKLTPHKRSQFKTYFKVY